MLLRTSQADKKLKQTQEDVEEIKILMVNNVNKVDERGEKLDDLDKRAEELRFKVCSHMAMSPSLACFSAAILMFKCTHLHHSIRGAMLITIHVSICVTTLPWDTS